MENSIKDYMATIGKKGGKATKKKYGKDYYRKLAEKRWEKLSTTKPLA